MEKRSGYESREIVREREGRWQMADGRWQMADGKIIDHRHPPSAISQPRKMGEHRNPALARAPNRPLAGSERLGFFLVVLLLPIATECER
jgi:hypothetical protein